VEDWREEGGASSHAVGPCARRPPCVCLILLREYRGVCGTDRTGFAGRLGGAAGHLSGEGAACVVFSVSCRALLSPPSPLLFGVVGHAVAHRRCSLGDGTLFSQAPAPPALGARYHGGRFVFFFLRPAKPRLRWSDLLFFSYIVLVMLCGSGSACGGVPAGRGLERAGRRHSPGSVDGMPLRRSLRAGRGGRGACLMTTFYFCFRWFPW